MTKHLLRSTSLLLFAIILAVPAKSLMRHQNASAVFTASRSAGTGLSSALRTFESTLTPYLRAHASHTAIPASTYVPGQADYFLLAKHWSQLSQTFLELYLKAAAISPGLKTYVSPGGHFDIIYSDTGADAIDMTDTMGYSPANWRVRTHAANGVPDYVEWVAYAADSAWSMEVDRFGFVNPFPYVGNGYASTRFKIYIRSFTGPESDTYAVTFPDNMVSPTAIGFRSHIEIRNEWNEDPWNYPPKDYKTHPEKAIQVTCVHEFFHTIQYAMTRQIIDDYIPIDFPVSWIEGSAVLMEDCGFNYVHDYLQYLDAYFGDPTSQVLEPADIDVSVYKNSIVALFLYQKTADTPCICFVKNMFFSDYQKPVGFVSNLRSSAGLYGHAWTDLLGDFHTQSYYTGSRAVNGRFIKDAALCTLWTYRPDGAGGAQSFTKTVQPFAMNTFSLLHQAGDADALNIGFLGDSLNTGETDTNALWSVHCILKRNNTPADDSVFVLPKLSLCRGMAAINGWHRFTEALVIATNGRYDLPRLATVTFEACAVTVHAGETDSFSAVPYATSNSPKATVAVKANADLLCTLAVAGTAISNQMSTAAAGGRLVPLGAFFNLAFPLTWLYNASIDLTISEPFDSVRSRIDTAVNQDSAIFLYRWDNSQLQWQRCPATVSRLPDSSFVFVHHVSSSGIFGLFEREQDTAQNIVAFPNPAHLKSGGSITFAGRDLLEIWIYTIDGFLLCHGARGSITEQSLGETNNGFSWRLQSNRGKPVSPGVYYARIGYKDALTKGMKRKLQKVFVLP